MLYKIENLLTTFYLLDENPLYKFPKKKNTNFVAPAG